MTRTSTPKKARILIIDDEEDIRGLLQELLEMEGYSVDAACDGQDALDRLHGYAAGLAELDPPRPHDAGEGRVCFSSRAGTRSSARPYSGRGAFGGCARRREEEKDGRQDGTSEAHRFRPLP